LIENIRAVELQAVMAQAAKSMKYYAELIDAHGDMDLWTRMEREYMLRLRDLWHDEWFHDYDTAKKTFTPYTDPLHLTPIMVVIAILKPPLCPTTERLVDFL
ncbi:unnamed protein product, partial [marine sediment metagenome]